jgi:hypothetical protein
LRLKHPRAGVILGGNQFDVLFLAPNFTGDSGGEFFVEPGDSHLFAEHWASPARLKKAKSYWN